MSTLKCDAHSIPWAAQDELYAELSKVSNVAALSPHERAVYDEHLRQYRDNLAMIEAAHQDGEIIGRDKEKRGIARNMLADGCPIQSIVKYTGLSAQEIEALK